MALPRLQQQRRNPHNRHSRCATFSSISRAKLLRRRIARLRKAEADDSRSTNGPAMELIALIAAAAGLLWATILMYRGGLIAVCTSVVLAGIVLGPSFLSLPGGPMPITIDRVLLGGLIVAYGLARWLGWVDARPTAAADMILLSLVGILTFNVFLHDWKINRSQPLSYLVFLWLMPAALYWVTSQVRLSERGMKYLFGVFGAFGLYLAFTAVCEAKYKWGFVFPRYIVSPEFKEWIGRGRGPLLNPAGNGILMTVCMVCGFMAWPRLAWRGRMLLMFAFLPVISLGVYYTLTRSAWMGFALAALVMVAVYLPKRFRVPAIVSVLLVSSVYTAANWERLLAFKRDKELTPADAADSASLRPILAYVGWQMFQDRPILGVGLGHYEEACPPYLTDRSIDLPLYKVRPYVQHNALLSMLVETGLIGTTAWLLLIFLWCREAWRLWRAERRMLWQRQVGLLFLAAMAAYLPNAIFQDTTIIPMANMLMFFLAALVMNVSRPRIAKPPEHRTSTTQFSADVEREWFGQRRPLEHV